MEEWKNKSYESVVSALVRYFIFRDFLCLLSLVRHLAPTPLLYLLLS